MPRLHITQGGIEYGDKEDLEDAASGRLTRPRWSVPKGSAIGDEVVIYLASYGFFATARIRSLPAPRQDRPGRYGSTLSSVRLIQPPISLAVIKKRIPGLTWAKYPRGIITQAPELADRIRELIQERRKNPTFGIDDQTLPVANIDELRKAALMTARPAATQRERKTIERLRSRAIRLYVLRRANGRCEGCSAPAPFRARDGLAYLEPHHTTRLSDEGPDHPAHVIGLCPNCHRRAHYSEDKTKFNAALVKRLPALEPRR